jgi:cytochrome P450
MPYLFQQAQTTLSVLLIGQYESAASLLNFLMHAPTLSQFTSWHLLGGLLLVAVVNALLVFYRLWLHPLAVFPGPRLWAASRVPWVRQMVSGRMWHKLELLHQKHGAIVRIAPNELSISSPQAWPDIYTSRPILAKEPTSQTPPLNGAHSLFTAVGEDHRRIRGAMALGFSDKALRDQAPVIECYATELVARLRREIAIDSVIDIQKFFGYAALDTIADLSYGSSLEGLPARNEHDWLNRFFIHGKFSTIRMSTCWLYPLGSVIGFIALWFTRKERSRNWGIFTAKIEERINRGHMDHADLISPVIGKLSEGVKSEPNTKGVSKLELQTHMLASIIANSQITTVVLASTAYFLLLHENVLQQLIDEIRGSFDSDAAITVQSTQSLTYLEAVIREVIRVHHPTPMNLPRVVPREGRIIDGTFIPGGTIIGINLHVIQRSPEFWVDGHAFHPERFLPPSDPRYDERFRKDVKTAYMPFSTGPRNCIGAKYVPNGFRLR